MQKWGEFEFNAPYEGDVIEKINEVVLPKDYVEFMKKHNGGEGDIGEAWLVLYPLEELLNCLLLLAFHIDNELLNCLFHLHIPKSLNHVFQIF